MNTPEQQKQRNHSKNMNDQTHYISDLNKIPDYPHFAVLYQEYMTYDAGYGDGNTSSMNYLVYIVFDTEEALNHWILKETEQSYNKKKFKVIYASPAEVKITTNVIVKK